VIDQKRSHKPPFSARCRDMAANRGAVDYVLPIVGQSQIDQRLQQGIPLNQNSTRLGIPYVNTA